MADTSLEGDCLFQLNVLIWASFPQPEPAPWNPVLLDLGYSLWSVEQPLEADIGELAAINKCNPRIGPNPVADAVLYHAVEEAYAVLENKPSSFGEDSSNAQQARGLVVAASNVGSRMNVPSDVSGEVVYVVPVVDAPQMDASLTELAAGVVAQGFTICPTGALGLAVRDDGVYLGQSAESVGGARLSAVLTPEQLVAEVPAGQDPRPLYVIPWIPNAPREADLRAFEEKIRSQVLAWLGQATVPGTETLEFGTVLNAVSRGIFNIWRDRGALRGEVFPVIRRIMSSLLRGDKRVTVGRDRVQVSLGTVDDKDGLMEKVRIKPLTGNEGSQLSLEDVTIP